MTMKEIKFCQHCGEKRQGKAAFCTACGHGFQKATKGNAHVITGVAVVVLSLLVFAGIKITVLKDAPQKEAKAPNKQNNLPAGHPPVNDAHLQELIAHANTGHADGLLDLAEYQLAQSGKDRKFLGEAVVTLDRFLQSWPDHSYAQRLIGNVYFDLGQSENAVKWYQRYLAKHPEDANIQTDLGTQLLMLERIDEAIACYKKALELYPDFYNAYVNLSVAYDKKGDAETAESYRAQAEKLAKEGKTGLAPKLKLPRLPEGDPHATAPGSVASTANAASSGSGRYQVMESFFREHAILGPKMEKFVVESGTAQAWMRSFPMQAIPAPMRESLDAKIKGKLAEVGDGAALEIRDAASGDVMASYQL